MSYTINCYNKVCGHSTKASDIMEFIENHTDIRFDKDGCIDKVYDLEWLVNKLKQFQGLYVIIDRIILE